MERIQIQTCLVPKQVIVNYAPLFFHYADVNGDDEDNGDDGVNDSDDEDIDCNKLMNSIVELSSLCARDGSKTMLTTNTRGTCNTTLQENTASWPTPESQERGSLETQLLPSI